MAIKFKVGTVFGGRDETSKIFKRMGRNADKFGNRTKRAFDKGSRSATRFGTITKGILGAQLIGAGVAKLKQGVGIVASEFLDFNDTITQAVVKFKDVGPRAENFTEKLKDLKIQARAVASETIFTGPQVGLAFRQMAQGGFKYSTALKSIRGQIGFALATGEDFVDSTKISTKILGGFGLAVDDPIQKVKNLAFVNDVLAKTVNNSAINLENFFDAAKDIGPIARNLNSSLPEVASFVGVLGNSAIDATKAMTGMRSIFLRMAAPPTEARKVLRRLGLSLDDGTGKAKTMTQFLGELAETTKDFGEIKKAGVFEALFGKIGVASAFILTDEINTGVKDFRKEIDGAAGEVKAMSDIMQNTLLSKVKILKSASTELGFKFTEIFEKKGRGAILAMTKAIQEFDIKPVRELFEILEKAGKSTQLGGPILAVLNAIARVLKVISRISLAGVVGVAEITGIIVGDIKELTRARTPEEKAAERGREIEASRLREQRRRETIDRLFPPNQAAANNVNVGVGVETTINAPQGTTSETKARRVNKIDRNALGPNNVLATQ